MFSPESERTESREKQESNDIFSNSLTISEEGSVQVRIERTTFRLTAECSNQLSYKTNVIKLHLSTMIV